MAKVPKSELMTVTETCQYLKITHRTLYRYLQNRQIPAFKLGKEWRCSWENYRRACERLLGHTATPTRLRKKA